MSDSDDAEETPAVELGEGPVVEGAPLARVASRLTWPIERSRLLRREGETTIRTPDGPRSVAEAVESVDVTYFDTRQTFVDAVREAIGSGPVATANDESSDDRSDDTETTAPLDGDGTAASANGTAPETDAGSDGGGPAAGAPDGDGDGETSGDGDAAGSGHEHDENGNGNENGA